MAKRFTETGKWKDTWFQDLPTKYKLFWIYLLDECDPAGIWKPNIRLAIFQIGEPFEESELKRIFADRIEVTETGYWFIKKFIDFQYGKLSENSKPHLSVLKLLENHKIKGYAKGIDTLKDKDKDKDKEQDKDKHPLLECQFVAEKDKQWMERNNPTKKEFETFNNLLLDQGEERKSYADYKKHFSNWKKKQQPEAEQKPQRLKLD